MQDKEIISWLNESIDKVSFGEIAIKIIRHDSQTRYIEKSITEKIRIMYAVAIV